MSMIKSIASDRLAILFMVMMVASAGNTAFQSILPSIASELAINDVWISIAFSWSALLWVILAPKWARMSDRRGRKMLMKIGTWGFILSMALTGLTLWLGIAGLISSMAAFILFAIFRSIYGALGSAAPPAVQAYVAARTDRSERAGAMALLASSFGLGTVIGPAIAHYLIFEPLGLVGPMVIFAGVGLLLVIALQFRLPNDEPKFEVKGIVGSYPSSAGELPRRQDSDEEEDAASLQTGQASAPVSVRLPIRDPRILPWVTAGLIGGHAHAAMMGVIGFLVRDRLGLADDPSAAVQAIGSVMFIGAMATLLAQWGLIPILSMKPRASVLWGGIAALIGVAIVAVSRDFYGISLGYAVSALGFGLFRPGFTAGASLAVRQSEQGDVAGKVASINGSAYIFAPAVTVALFNWREPAAFVLVFVALIGLLIWGRRALIDD